MRLTKDGLPVLLHDASLDRLWGQDRLLADVTAAELTALTGGGVPTLREALLATTASRLMIDLPGATEEAVRTVIGVVRESGAADRVFYTAGPTTMLAVRNTDASAEIAMTWKSVAPPVPALLAAVRPRWLNYRFGLISTELVERNHRDGLLVSAWTVDTARSMQPSWSSTASTRSPRTGSTSCPACWRRSGDGAEPAAGRRYGGQGSEADDRVPALGVVLPLVGRDVPGYRQP